LFIFSLAKAAVLSLSPSHVVSANAKMTVLGSLEWVHRQKS